MNDTQIPLGDHADKKGTAAMVKNLRSIRLFLVEGINEEKGEYYERETIHNLSMFDNQFHCNNIAA